MNINLANTAIHQKKTVSAGNMVGYTKQHEVQAEKKTAKKSATVELSDSGLIKSSHHQTTPQAINTDDIPGSDYKKTLEGILQSVRNGEKLSQDDQKWLNDELKSMTSDQYDKMKNLRLSDDDKEVLAELRKHYMQRQEMFQDLLKEVNSQKADSQAISDVQFLASQLESKEKEEMVEVLKESLDLEDEEEVSEDSDSSKAVEDEEEISGDNPEENNLSLEESTIIKDEGRAMDVISGNKEKLKAMDAQKTKESIAMHQYDAMLDSLYADTQKALADEKMDIKDKVKTYDYFKETSNDLARSREISRHKMEFDFETKMIGKIMFQSHNDMSEVLKKYKSYKPNLIGKDIVMNFLK